MQTSAAQPSYGGGVPNPAPVAQPASSPYDGAPSYAVSPPNPAPVAPPPPTEAAEVGASMPTRFIPAGASLAVRLDESIGTRRNRAGDGFDATLARPLVVRGQAVLPAGTRFYGHVQRSKPSGRLKGRAVLVLTLDSFRWNGRRQHIRTDSIECESGNHRRRNEFAIGGGAGFGATMGAIAGGPVGAAVGAVAGAGSGAVGAALGGRREVRLRAETLVRFRLASSVRM